jgi:hypothetical protein
MAEHTAYAKTLASSQPRPSFSFTASGVTTCRPLPPVVLQKGDKAQRPEPILQLLGRCDHAVETKVGRWIKVEDEPARKGRKPAARRTYSDSRKTHKSRSRTRRKRKAA